MTAGQSLSSSEIISGVLSRHCISPQSRPPTIEMAETIEPTNTSGEPPNPAPESTDIPSADTTDPTADTSLPPIDTSLPPIDATMPAMDDHLPSLDHALPPIDATIPSLPPIDTSLPPLDTTLPATDTNLPGGEPDFSFDTKSLNDGHGSEATNSVPGTSYDFTEQSGQSSTPAPTYQSPANGTHLQPAQQQSQTPQGQPQQPQPQYHQPYAQHSPSHHAPSQQHQQHAQGQTQQYQPHQQSPDMYHSHQGHSTSMNTPSMQPMDPHGQSSQMPQAPIGSPMPSNMPPMASVGQYMTGYPTNVGQMGMSPNAQMRYQLPGDPNKLLSGGRHKKEVKRRTKTGCLTCRKRRIKVRARKTPGKIRP